MKTLHTFIVVVALALGSLAYQSSQSGTEIGGNWLGVLNTGESQLRLLLKISAGENGSITAVMDSLDQPNSNNLQVDAITFKGNVLHFDMKALQISYEGTRNHPGEIAGTFTQGGASLPLIFRKEGFAKSTTVVKRGRIELKPCNDPNLDSEVLCTNYEVFEDRAARAGRKISINIILLPALSSTRARDPVFYFAGGPGGAATSYAAEPFMKGLRRNRDVVLIDQRGTGQSNPLNCPSAGSRQDMRGFFGEVMPLERIRACRSELEKVANLKLYTTAIAMDDIDEVRSALGYDRINVYGGSYGSTAALAYLRQYPMQVRTMAIFGVAPTSAKIPLSFSKGVQDAMDRLFKDCAADSTCHAAYPDLEDDFKKVMAQFDKGPVEVTATNVFTRSSQKVTVTRDAFVDGIRQVLYVPAAAAALPALIHLGAQGNLGALVGTAFQIVQAIDSRIARGMQFSVICSEDVPFMTAEEIKTTSANSFYGDARVRPTMRACTEWPQAKVSATFLEPVKSDVPALLLAGELDPVTPPWLAETVLRTLSKGRLIVIPNATHASYECVENLVADFIDKGTTEGLDVSCVHQIKRPPFTILK